MKNLSSKILSAIAMLALLIGCNPQGPEKASDYDVVITNYDKSAEFGNITTFGMPWKVTHVGDTTESENSEMDLVILNTTKAELEKMNYRFLPENSTEKPDVVALCYAVTTTTVHSWWSWWGGYPGWGYPGYPGYPWYPYPVQGIYAYQKGTIMIELANNTPTNLPAAEADSVLIPILWEGVTNGFTTNTQNEMMRAEKNIQQMFIQSPYLMSNSSN
ncbi:DUF4136 domain-containing protein [Flammeovirga kamogawensis]|uniref:DUF4136 domain-containing protein n=1 Tax=Flammeovirga kamogawensis TaxID=373891 RepID=A0ABX8GXE3_9BACT|nr:DUF4136 domain-containing protein [Flammeovirga kamogawensis]MBB6460719.1 hypothetical protein [Flammeovirga kamogawensis]QWG08073.1 DUF4136 domain-containing protein [Flammeovirga kamogawensis]TRX69878.1 DUF4136 domain-containing protein [Flammeovirga kamogawensis]